MGQCSTKTNNVRVAPWRTATCVQKDIDFMLTRCVVCYEGDLEVVITPCNHLCLCIKCRDRLRDKKCPICRGQLENSIRVFIPVEHRHVKQKKAHNILSQTV